MVDAWWGPDRIGGEPFPGKTADRSIVGAGCGRRSVGPPRVRSGAERPPRSRRAGPVRFSDHAAT